MSGLAGESKKIYLFLARCIRLKLINFIRSIHKFSRNSPRIAQSRGILVKQRSRGSGGWAVEGRCRAMYFIFFYVFYVFIFLIFDYSHEQAAAIIALYGTWWWVIDRSSSRLEGTAVGMQRATTALCTSYFFKNFTVIYSLYFILVMNKQRQLFL